MDRHHVIIKQDIVNDPFVKGFLDSADWCVHYKAPRTKVFVELIKIGTVYRCSVIDSDWNHNLAEIRKIYKNVVNMPNCQFDISAWLKVAKYVTDKGTKDVPYSKTLHSMMTEELYAHSGASQDELDYVKGNVFGRFAAYALEEDDYEKFKAEQQRKEQKD